MSATSKLSLKLLIDQTTNRVVFAEAGKETIDFLFSFLTLPVATVVRLLSKQGMVGCLTNLYDSVENLNVEYVQPNLNKDVLLKPNACTSTQQVPLFLLSTNSAPKKRKLQSSFYVCSSTNINASGSSVYGNYPIHVQYYYVTGNYGSACPSCRNPMTRQVELVGDIWVDEETVVHEGGGGFVKGVVTYMIMDDLVVKPSSTISSVALLKELKVKDVDALEEKVVDLNIDMGLRLLKMAFRSKEVLTSVFLRQENPSVKEELSTS